LCTGLLPQAIHCTALWPDHSTPPQAQQLCYCSPLTTREHRSAAPQPSPTTISLTHLPVRQ
jgi:hypothetical protein